MLTTKAYKAHCKIVPYLIRKEEVAKNTTSISSGNDSFTPVDCISYTLTVAHKIHLAANQGASKKHCFNEFLERIQTSMRRSTGAFKFVILHFCTKIRCKFLPWTSTQLSSITSLHECANISNDSKKAFKNQNI